MGYEAALSKGWSDLKKTTSKNNHFVDFLNKEYEIDLNKGIVLCNGADAKVNDTVLILHYLRQYFLGLPKLSGEWISFNELEGSLGYYPVFRKRVLTVINAKYGQKQELFLTLDHKFKARKTKFADSSLEFLPFEGVPIAVMLWKADDEFGSEANILFDKTITRIFCTEDIVILSEILAHTI